MIKPSASLSIVLFVLCLFFLSALKLSAQDSLFVYKDGRIIYSSPTNIIDSLTFHPPGYWAQQRSEAVFESIRSKPELSTFAELLALSGYQTKLDDKTIWAPVNEALTQVDRSNPDAVRQLVENHISKGLLMLPYIEEATMLNQKIMQITRSDSNFYVGESKVLNRNKPVAKSITHTIEQLLPYRPNAWEYLNQAGSTDSVCAFIRSYNKKTYNSTTKDSVVSNELLTNIAASLNQESTEFTLLLPDDRLWNKTVRRLLQFYPATSDTIETKKRLDNVKRFILRDLFLKGRKASISGDTLLLTTLGNELVQPVQLFGKDSLLAKLSNGCALRVSTLAHLNDSVKTVRTEAENPTNRTLTNVNVKVMNRMGTTEFPISGNSYIEAIPMTTSSLQKTWVQFGIPHLLPGTYNIYAVILPAYMNDTTKILPNKIKFTLTYPNASGVSTTSTPVSNSETNPKVVSKILISSNFVVNFFNMSLAAATNPMIKVRVESVAYLTPPSPYNRNILTDCILFEPVQ